MPLGMEVGQATLSQMGTQLPPKNGTAPNFCLYLLWQMAGWIRMKLGMEVGLGPGDIVLHGEPAPPAPKRGTAPPNFWPMSVVAKRLEGSRCHLVQRWASAQVTLCWMGTQLLPQFSAHVFCSQMVPHLSYC